MFFALVLESDSESSGDDDIDFSDIRGGALSSSSSDEEDSFHEYENEVSLFHYICIAILNDLIIYSIIKSLCLEFIKGLLGSH